MAAPELCDDANDPEFLLHELFGAVLERLRARREWTRRKAGSLVPFAPSRKWNEGPHVRSSLSSAAVAAAAAIALVPLSPAPAAADETGNIVCHGGSINIQVNPGIAFSRGNVRLTASGDVGICNSGKHPRITGGTIRIETALSAACPGPIGPGYAKVTISWNDGSRSGIDQSTFRGDAQAFSLEGGAVRSGTFADGTARANGRTSSNLVELGAACAAGGLTSYDATIDELAVGEIYAPGGTMARVRRCRIPPSPRNCDSSSECGSD